jgi:DNA-binding Xre family transcriptional regulator
MVRLKVREVAEPKGINMAKLSRMADVSYNTTQALFHDPYHDVSIYILDRIAKALKVSICDLIEETPGEE